MLRLLLPETVHHPPAYSRLPRNEDYVQKIIDREMPARIEQRMKAAS